MIRRAPALLAVLLLAGCGSTVAMTSTTSNAGGALAADGTQQQPQGGGAPAGPVDGGLAGGGTSVSTSGSVAAGGGGTAPGAVGSGGSTPTALPLAGGVTVSKPITIGMVKTSTAGAASIGLKLDNSYTEQQYYDGVVNALNERGGLGGRRIKVVYDEVDPLGDNWAQQFAKVCTRFTQDNKVDLVLGYVFNYDQGFESCLAKRGIPHLSTTFNVPDETELRKFPLLVNIEVPTITRRTLAKLDGAFATGALTKTSKVGVVYDSCPGTERSYRGPAKQAFARYGMKVISEFQATCVTGQQDSGRSTAEIQSMGLQFRSAGVTHVLFHTVSEGPLLAFFAQNAESQNYHPTYVMSSLANLMFITTNPQLAPPAQARNVKAFGWMPFEDVTVDKYPAKNATQVRCLQLLRTKGIVARSSLDYKLSYQACEVFFLTERVLKATGGRSDGPTFVRGLQSLGTSFQSADKLGGESVFGATRYDAVLKARPLVWVDSCSCFNYTGTTRTIPS